MSDSQGGCQCIDLFNEALAEHNAKLDVPF